MSGLRNTYGADLLLVVGDPTKSLDFLTDLEKSLHIVMKGGGAKDTLS